MVVDQQADWSAVMNALQHHFERAGSFFAGAQLVIEVGGRRVSEDNLSHVLSLMEQYGLRPEAIATSNRDSRNAARAVGLETRAMPHYQQPQSTSASPDSDSLLVRRTVRSGQVVRHHGHITVIGDVNPGAQVIAGGSVVVWGRLRGLVHAGVLGDDMAVVCALQLRPTQLRIASLIVRTPEDEVSPAPEIARVEDHTILVESWDAYKR